MKIQRQTMTTLTLTLILLSWASPSRAMERTLAAESIRLVNIEGSKTDAEALWLETNESHGIAFLTFPTTPTFFANLNRLELILHTLDTQDAGSQDGLSLVAPEQFLGSIERIARNQAVIFPLDPNTLDKACPLHLILAPNGPDAVALMPQAHLKAHYVDSDPLKKGLVAEYLFNGNYQDTSGASLHGTPSGPCELVKDRFGKDKSALRIAGQKDAMVTVSHNKALNPEHLTLSAWVTGDNPKLWARILHKFNHREQVGYALFYCHTDKTIAFEAFGQQDIHLWRATSGTLSHSWQHVAFTYDGHRTCFYLNGKLEKTSPVEIAFKHTDKALVLGNGFDGNSYFPWKGLIDDVRLYNRGLSEMEIQALFNEQPKTQTQLIDLTQVDRL